MTINQPNLITMFRSYYKLAIPNFIDTSSHALFTGLLYKFNELGFPPSLKISINELLSLSGISDPRTFRRARKTLSEYLHDENNPDSWIMKYQGNAVKGYGIYQINYVMLQETYSKVTVDLQEDYNENGKVTGELQECSSKNGRLLSKNDDLPDKNALLSNTIQYNTRKEDISSCTSTNITYKEEDVDKIENEEKKEKDANAIKEEEEFQKTKIAIQTICPTFRIANAVMGNAVREISQYPEDKKKNVFQKAALKGLKVGDVLTYLKNGLEKYEELGYGNNGKKPIEQQVVHKEIEPFLSDEERESLEKEARAREKRQQAEWKKKQGIKEKAAISESEARYNGAKSDEFVIDEDFPPEVKEKIRQATELQAKRRS